MRDFRLIWGISILIACSSATGHAQVDRNQPTDDEIMLAVTQTGRALGTFDSLLDEQKSQLGKSATQQIEEARQHANVLTTSLKLLKSNPQSFNGPIGFNFLESLNSIDRGALQCSMAASSQSSGYQIAGKQGVADTLITLSQSCMDLSALVFTIREQVASLYRRYIAAEEHFASQSVHEARQCEDDLEKDKAKKFAPAFPQ